MKRAATVLCLSATALVAGCSSGSGHPSVHPTTTSALPPAQQLAHAVTLARSAQYTAAYLLSSPGRQVSLIVSKSSVGLRVDVVSPRNLASVFIVHGSVITCAGAHRTCLLVARAGRQVPPLFSSALTFTAFVDPAQFPTRRVHKVARDGTSPVAGSAPAGQCYDITFVDPAEVAVYCFGPTGVITRAGVGNELLTLTRLRGVPPARAFTPWTSPTPLP